MYKLLGKVVEGSVLSRDVRDDQADKAHEHYKTATPSSRRQRASSVD